MDTKRLRLELVAQGRRLVDLHRETGIPYNRIIRIVNRYCEARDHELLSIAAALGISAAELEPDSSFEAE